MEHLERSIAWSNSKWKQTEGKILSAVFIHNIYKRIIFKIWVRRWIKCFTCLERLLFVIQWHSKNFIESKTRQFELHNDPKGYCVELCTWRFLWSLLTDIFCNELWIAAQPKAFSASRITFKLLSPPDALNGQCALMRWSFSRLLLFAFIRNWNVVCSLLFVILTWNCLAT